MITRPIRAVQHHPDAGGVGGAWSILFDHETKGPWLYFLPVSSLWYRSAEYEIDLGDADTLFDTVLHEAAAMDFDLGVHHTDPDFVAHVPAAQAWQAHQARIAKVKQLVTHDDPQKLMSVITKHHLDNRGHKHLNQLYQDHRSIVGSIRKQRFPISQAP